MSEINALPRIPTNEQPTFWNRTMAGGALVGGLAGGAALLATTFLFPPAAGAAYIIGTGSALFTTALGAFLGGRAGRAQMEHDLVHGKAVKTPTFWNSGITKGLGLSTIINACLAVAGASLIAGTGIGAELAGVEAASLDAAFSAISQPIGLLATALSLVIPIKTGFDGKKEMQREFNQAVAMQQEQQLGVQHGLAPLVHIQQPSHVLASQPLATMPQQHIADQTYKNSVSPDEYALLQARMSAGKEAGGAVGQHASKVSAAQQAISPQSQPA